MARVIRIAVDLLLVGPEGPRSDEAHVALEDVEELGQLVHGRRPQDPADPGDPGIALDGLHRRRPSPRR